MPDANATTTCSQRDVGWFDGVKSDDTVFTTRKFVSLTFFIGITQSNGTACDVKALRIAGEARYGCILRLVAQI